MIPWNFTGKEDTLKRQNIILKQNSNEDDPFRIPAETNTKNEVQNSPVNTEMKPKILPPLVHETTREDTECHTEDTNMHMITYSLPSIQQFKSNQISRKNTETIRDADKLILELTAQNDNQENEERSYGNILDNLKSGKE